ncbi:MAG TPA: carboxylesterase family protein [Vicinamibacterales bacterium]|jgi:para-nitrobenzyl esterase
MKPLLAASLIALLLPAAVDRVDINSGPVSGTTEADGLRVYKGIPYAAPPVGPLRWQPPQPAAAWTEVRKATAFGAQCMQRRQFADMVFRASGMSEDCLFLNVWTPAKTGRERLPVLVYFYGGGFTAGDGSEPRYDGAFMARKGIVALTVNYRLGVFGFMAHPELTKESPKHASGDYGLLDQVAALAWVHDNIAAFGGDPRHVTIAGESAGSISVSALMASPLSRGLIAGAIGESGAAINPTFEPAPLAQAEKTGQAFATAAKAESLADLRAMPADAVLAVQGPRFPITIDGAFLPKSVADIFRAGEQAHVPLLAGWNSQESAAAAVLGRGVEPTAEGYAKAVRALPGFEAHADQVLALYSGHTPDEVTDAATALASDRFIAFSTWKWIDLHAQTGGKPTYRYYYSRPRPAMNPDKGPQGAARGAAHSAEIEYAMGNLPGNDVYAWTNDDRKVSETMSTYFANFIKTGDPNGGKAPKWPAIKKAGNAEVMHIDVTSRAEADKTRPRYLLLDRIYSAK